MTTTTQQTDSGEGVAGERARETSAAPGRVTFESQGETVVGRLYPAAFGDGPAPE
jgi:hypothetical protein